MSKLNLTFRGKTYFIDKTLLAGAVSDLEVTLSNLAGGSSDEQYPAAGLYETGAIALYQEQGASAVEGMMTMSWDELVDDGVIVVDSNKCLTTANTVLTGDLVMPDDGSITSIGYCGFFNCTSLKSVIVSNGVTSIGGYAFQRCLGLTSINIPNSVTSIGNGAFSSCNNLTDITIPNSVTSIGEKAFYDCYRLTSITIPDSVTSIEKNTFLACSGLTSITIPNSVTSIGEGAFTSCGLTSITFNGTMAQWGQINKNSSWNSNVPATYVQCSDGQATI